MTNISTIKKLPIDQKRDILRALLNDIKPNFTITAEAVYGGKYSEFEIESIELSDHKLEYKTLSAKVGQKVNANVKY